jgi:hypothetical protein
MKRLLTVLMKISKEISVCPRAAESEEPWRVWFL